MNRTEKRRAAQRDSAGNLAYRVGFAGGTSERADDLTGRKPKNVAEAACYDTMTADGWTLTKRGWPDFFCVRGGEFCAVEVKPHKNSALKRNQLAVMGMLSAKGVKCFMWSPDGGFEEVRGTLTSFAE